MAVTSEASSKTNFPLHILNTGPSYFRDAPTKEQQMVRKSAMERLAESRANFVQCGSGEELDHTEKEENLRKPNETYKSHHIPSTNNDIQSHVFRAVPYICGDDGDRGPEPANKSRPHLPPPTPDKPKPEAKVLRKGSRDRTLEIVAASLAHSERQNVSSDDDICIPSQGNLLSTTSSASNSPMSPRDSSSAGSRVRRLKEQFLGIGSAESDSDTSQGRVTQNCERLPGLSRSLKGSREIDHSTKSNFIKARQPQSSHQSTEKPKLQERDQAEVCYL